MIKNIFVCTLIVYLFYLIKPISPVTLKQRIDGAVTLCCGEKAHKCCLQNLEQRFGDIPCDGNEWDKRSNCIEEDLHGTSVQLDKPYYCCALYPTATCRYRCNNWLRSIRLPLHIRLQQLEKDCPFFPKERNRSLGVIHTPKYGDVYSWCADDLEDARHVCVRDCLRYQHEYFALSNFYFNHMNLTHCPTLHINTNYSTSCLGEELNPTAYFNFFTPHH